MTPKIFLGLKNQYGNIKNFDDIFDDIFATPLAEKMHSLFSTSHQSENPFPAFFFVTIFHPSLIYVPIIHIEGF
jgi:hypothetical protein